MEAIADQVIGLLRSLATKELELLCNFRDDLETLKRKMVGIRAVLRDAERQATQTEAVSVWLQKLKDTLLDVEDLLDAYSAEELAREVMTKDKMAKEVRIFFSKSNRIVCACKMGRKIRAIRMIIDEIYDEKDPFKLQESSSSTSNESYEWRRTDPFVSELDVVGRDEERKLLVSILLSPTVNSEVSVVPIVGIGGSGKTTLAQLVYNDVSVQNHFELMKWVCVSDETHALSNHKLAQMIIGQRASSQTQGAVEELRRTIEGKLFLLVLDDVWNIKNRGEWLRLENLFRSGREGSKIIVTTRSLEVADTMGTRQPLSLEGLGEDESWELFRRVAFRDGDEPDDEVLVGIGKDIVRKCAGVPLAIRTIGSLLFTKKLGVTEWSYFRDSELANLDSEDNRILSILKLSYDHLPPHLKNCFAFFSLFPKDYELERALLIQLWIAEGFIQPLDTNKQLEDVGNEYFIQLLSRCLFQDVRRDDFGDIVSCKMHDLIHDLALSLTKNESYIVKTNRRERENFCDGVHHVSSHVDRVVKFEFDLVKTKRVRTILSPVGRWKFIQSHVPSRYFNPIGGSTMSLPKHLRVLDLSRQQLIISESIGDLKHLKYLDLSGNWVLEKLSQGVTKLHNLLSLRLNKCWKLIELPRGIQRLMRLRHLELDGCSSLICMPHGLGSLANLQTLTKFVVDKRSGGDGVRINELRDLIWLRGGLQIEKLERQRSHIEEVKSSKFLLGMRHLERLSLRWDHRIRKEEEHKHKDEMILEALAPPHTIKKLFINGFDGECLSEWIGSLTSLRKITLNYCTSLRSLPRSIGRLTSLQDITLDCCTSLRSLPESVRSLTSLQGLTLDCCTSLTSLPESIGSLTSLQKITLNNCTSLASIPEPIGSLTSLQKITIKNCTSLVLLPESIGTLTSLQEITLDNCTSLASIPESIGSLTSLQKIRLYNCISLTSLPESVRSLTSF